MPLPATVISRQPMRADSKPSASEIVVGAAIDAGAAKRAHEPHRREAAVARAGTSTPAAVSAAGRPRRRPSSDERRPTRGSAARPTRRARRRRPRRRRPRRGPRVAWKVGISASSMTTSRRTRSGSTRMPGVVVDREVAQRVGQHGGRGERRSTRAARRRSGRAGSRQGPPASLAARSRAAGSSAGPRASARSRSFRAASVGPVGRRDQPSVVPDPRVLGAGRERRLHRGERPRRRPAFTSAHARAS